MAKPGTDAARELTDMARGATIVGNDIPDSIKAPILAQLEGKLGFRCGGCHRRIRIGIQFTKIDVKIGVDGTPQAAVARLSACSAEDCDFAREAMEGATVMEMVEYQWLDVPPGHPAEADPQPQEEGDEGGRDVDPGAGEGEPVSKRE